MTLQELHWTEKYRPDTLDDVIGNEHIVASLQQWADAGDMPNLLLSGPAGTGKTALATAIAKDYYGDDWRRNFMELNASDDRGIDVVRDNIKSYAEQGTSGEYDFKIIFLDEADALTKDAQSALRRVMEDYAADTRFILSCNYVNKLIDPIQSRCAVFTVEPLDNDQIREILQRVIDGEGIETDDGIVDIIVNESRGDARRAINTLQAATTGDRVSEETLTAVVRPIDGAEIEEIIRQAIGGDHQEARQRLNEDVLKQGVDPGDLAWEMVRALDRIDMPEQARYLCVDAIAEAEWRSLEGAHPHVQFSSCLAKVPVARHLSFDEYNDVA